MLILAGVSLNAIIGDNGIITKAQEAKKLSEQASDEESLKLMFIENIMNDKNTKKVGIPLYDRNFEHNADWHVIKYNETIYGTGWYYVVEGTSLNDNEKAKSNYLVNYEEGKVIVVNPDEIISLSVGESMSVTDNIILNIDGSIFDKKVENNRENIESYLGNGVTLEGFNYDDTSGINNGSFKFDGIDDVIKIPYNDSKNLNAGLTLEFYGNIIGAGNMYKTGTNDLFVDSTGHVFNGFLSINAGKQIMNNGGLTFGIDFDGYSENSVEKPKQIAWYLPSNRTIPEGFIGDLGALGKKDYWDRMLLNDCGLSEFLNNDVYFTVSLNSTEGKESFFVNGKKLYSRNLD